MREEPYKHVVTRHVGPNGRRCKSTDPGAVQVKEETRTYYGDLPALEEGARPERVSLETADLGAAWLKLTALRKAREREKEGLADPVLGAARRPLAAHLEEWLAEVGARGTSGAQVKLLRSRVTHLATIAGWAGVGQITGPSAAGALSGLESVRRRGMPEGYDGLSVQTRNHYLSALKQFVAWCVSDERLTRNPLTRLHPLPTEGEERHARRPPTDLEVARLMIYLEGSKAPSLCRMTSAQRALGYRLAMATGFRAGELRSLRRRSFDLAAGTVTLSGGSAKNRRRANQPLPPWLVQELTVWLGEPGRGLWADLPENWPGRLLYLDQQAAGVEYVLEGADGTPLYFDFHSLRHWYCTWAANQPGISPKTLLELARHSDPRLTLERYAKAQEGEARKLVDSMPRPGLNRAG